jgi:CRP-like cAMP-binding protein
VRGEKDVERVWKMLHKGDTFGETALKSEDGKRSANAKCTQSSILLIIQCEDYLAIEAEHEVFLREQKLQMVRRCPAFRNIKEHTQIRVADRMHIKRYDANTVITNRGEKSRTLCLVRKGMIKVLKSTPLDLCEQVSPVSAPSEREKTLAAAPTTDASANNRRQRQRATTDASANEQQPTRAPTSNNRRSRGGANNVLP